MLHSRRLQQLRRFEAVAGGISAAEGRACCCGGTVLFIYRLCRGIERCLKRSDLT